MNGPTIVTGAAGFAGSHLVDLLAADGVDTVAWHRPGGRAQTTAPGVAWHGVNLLDRDAVAAAIRAIQPATVFHCGGAAHVAESWHTVTDTLAVNVLGTHYLVEALRDEAPHARLLVPSSALVYAASTEAIDEGAPLVPGSPYGLSKLAQEAASTRFDGPAACIARPFNHFGPRQSSAFSAASFARQIAEIEAGRQAPEMSVGNLEARRDLTDVRDTVRAYRLIADRGQPGRPYNVCSGRALRIRDELDALLTRARVRIKVVADPKRLRPSDVPVLLGSPARVTSELGWEPQIPFEQTIDDLLEHWRARVAAG